MRDTEKEREAETQAEGEAGSVQGAQHGPRSPVSRIRPWAEGGAKPLSHPGCPTSILKKKKKKKRQIESIANNLEIYDSADYQVNKHLRENRQKHLAEMTAI